MLSSRDAAFPSCAEKSPCRTDGPARSASSHQEVARQKRQCPGAEGDQRDLPEIHAPPEAGKAERLDHLYRHGKDEQQGYQLCHALFFPFFGMSQDGHFSARTQDPTRRKEIPGHNQSS
ncbi:hypothetical protein RHECNPAF_770081 [Rhizobium etli CNPAF512]|nr:hypothetical protein RHECNPAF_770081 [Rhizobium etli CNPAF512]